jgi:hypothetical protein
MGQINRHREYDDPYRLLAAYIVSVFSAASIRRIMTNNAYVRSLIINETKTMDIAGAFLDCIDQEIVANDMVRRKNVFLKKLGEFYYSELDIERLRDNIRRFADEVGLRLD